MRISNNSIRATATTCVLWISLLLSITQPCHSFSRTIRKAFSARQLSKSTSQSVALSSTSTSTSASTALTWDRLQSDLTAFQSEHQLLDTQTPLLTFYRDTNGWCPFCERIWLCLRFKQIPYRERLIALFDKPEWYKEMVPTSQVPAVLIHGDIEQEEQKTVTERRLVWDSLPVMKALDDAFPDTKRLVLDTEEYKQASALVEQLGSAGAGFVYAGRNATLTPTEVKEKRNAFEKALDSLEELLVSNGGPFLLGTEFTGVDAQVVPTLERWRYQLPLTKQIDILESRPGLQGWFAAMEKLDAYSERVMGDEYSWTVTAAMFVRYFGGGDADEETQAQIERSVKRGEELALNFKDSVSLEDLKSRFVSEAAAKLLSNRDAIVKDCTNADPKSQTDVPRSASIHAAEDMLQFVTHVLLPTAKEMEEGEDIVDVLSRARSLPFSTSLNEMDSKDRLDAAVAATTIARRLCVPRDMSAPAAKVLRAVLAIVSNRLENV